MPNIQRNFIKGRMNKSIDERLVANGEYIDAMNVRLGSTEDTEIGSVENSKGNTALSDITYNSVALSDDAKCIGAFEDGARETIYWFVTDPNFSGSTNTGKLDLILSFNVATSLLTYHVISIDDGGGVNTTLNFNSKYLITGVDMVEDLLFFTDDYNPPRKINITRNYADPNPIGSGVDESTLADDLLVIKAPPVMAPKWSFPGANAPNQENYIKERFICFAYRYRYADGEYSATSQFSKAAFLASNYSIDSTSYLNTGMTNLYNQVDVSFNAGGPLVKDIELLFKDSDSSLIRVIEKFNKAEEGWLDNVDYTYRFNNSKTYTVLSSSEILRLYDNVPRFAKAQTIMGNRLMYGNYIDGYDLKDANDNPIKLNYTTEVVQSAVIIEEFEANLIQLVDVDYTVFTPVTINNAGFTIDLTGKLLNEGAVLSFTIRFRHDSFAGTSPPTEITGNVDIDVSFILQQDYPSVYDLATSPEFLAAIGTNATIQPFADACLGTTLTDEMNCLIPQNLGAYSKVDSGISAIGQAIDIIANPGSNIIQLDLVAAYYVNGAINLYEYYEIQFVDAFWQTTDNLRSLHSDRDYEVGIVYMDNFNRATTALVSEFNTVHVPCGNSGGKNQIFATLPVDMLAPKWATRYKWVVQENVHKYETIYSLFFVEEVDTNSIWFLLEGENAAKVNKGDRLKVKADSSGAVNGCVWTTILDKEAKPADFTLDPADPPQFGVKSPSGVYVKVNPNNFDAVYDSNSIIDLGKRQFEQKDKGEYPQLKYFLNLNNSTQDFDIPVGSTIRMNIEFSREGKGSKCGKDSYYYDKSFVSSQNYDNFYDWFVGDGVNLTTGDCEVNNGETCNSNIFNTNPPPPSGAGTGTGNITAENSKNFYQFFRATPTHPTNPNALVFMMSSGTPTCSGSSDKRHSWIKCQIEVFRASSQFVFETEPVETTPDLYYEGNMTYFIDANGYHLTTNPDSPDNQDQTATQQGEVYLDFFNCFAFGNGVESYKIQDSITGRALTLGNRVVSVSAQDFKEADRFADITYSGVYNDESNVNKLNEFNLGLLNFFPLEDSYGELQILHGRATDILTLQEDKISYVTVGKNILTDAVGGGTVTSVPEVLGQQVARQDAYGISNNPESFVAYGYDKYFTDSKRGAVLRLKGSAGSNEQLTVISEAGLRSWFRNLFIDYPATQKLGGFDPYMNEFVLSSNERLLPAEEKCIGCGVLQDLFIKAGKTYTFCIELGSVVGSTNISYNISEGIADISVVYDSVTTSTGNVSGGGVLTYNKSLPGVTTASITITPNAVDTTLSIQALCPGVVSLTVIQVCVTNNSEAFQSIHNEYTYTDGTYVSPTNSTGVIFASGSTNPLITSYTSLTGGIGDSNCPTDGSTVTMISNKLGANSFVFDPTGSDKFRYLKTNTLYANNPASVQSLISASTQATPLITTFAPNRYSAEFTMPSGVNTYLYLIWDYRDSIQHDLCFDSVLLDSCCGCTQHWYLMRNSADSLEEYHVQSPVALTLGTYYTLIGMGTRCFEVISTTTTIPTKHINTTCTP
jgi:hypothetical protein|tara:strand:+ start:4085 stop:8698 length:4614 start_codon:yes stop_codon:yes gene_type:complete